jgi:ATP-dependent helicase/nuclease subunit A
LAQYIADFIRNAIADNVFVESKNRSARASDFLILFQRRDIESMKDVVNAMKNVGVPVAGIDKVLLKDELIVEDLIVFAEFSLFPLDDLACARVLKSPIVGMHENDLMRACLDRKDEHLWDFLLKNNALCESYSLRELQKFIEKAYDISVYDFFMFALTSGIKEKFVCRLGEKCLDVLYEFLDVATTYEGGNTSSLHSFLQWFRSFEHEIKRESFSNEDSVRLMTAHASKGLQSPFVILADANFFRVHDDKLLQSEDGILVWDFSSDSRSSSIEKLRRKYEDFHMNESRRLLYVAMTRAEDFLYILGEKQNKKIHDDCWYNFIKTNASYDDIGVIESSTNSSIENICDVIANPDELPSWFGEKLPPPESDSPEKFEETSEIIYGDCVHLLLCELPKYDRSAWDVLADDLLNKLELSNDMKNAAKSESYRVLNDKNFDFIFSMSSSLGEASFICNGKEGRIDRMVRCDDYLLIIDFKTGYQKTNISSRYLEQLSIYKESVKSICGSKVQIKTAILWTRSSQLVEV